MAPHIRFIGLTLLLIACVAAAQTPPAQAPVAPVPLALFVVHFATGPKWDAARPPAEQSGFSEHSANLNRLRQEGTIKFGARYGELGMIVVQAASIDAARSLIDADPGVRAGIFTFQIAAMNVFYPWRE